MRVNIEQREDKSYIAYNTTGEKVQLIGTGMTIEECKEDFINSIEEAKATYDHIGDAMPECLREALDFVIYQEEQA